RGRGRRGALPHEDDRLARRVRGGEDGRHVPARAVEVGLDDVEDEPRGGGRVERVPATLEDGLCGRGGDPVGRGRHPEGALERGAGGEGGRRGERGRHRRRLPTTAPCECTMPVSTWAMVRGPTLLTHPHSPQPLTRLTCREQDVPRPAGGEILPSAGDGRRSVGGRPYGPLMATDAVTAAYGAGAGEHP